MIRTEKEGHIALLKVAFPYLLLSAGYAGVVLMAEELVGDHIYKISGQVGSVFGLAVAFFLGFRMNSAYDRWWEARKIVGELTNNTRSFAQKVHAYLRNPANLRPDLQVAPDAVARTALELLRLYVQQWGREISGKSAIAIPAELAAQHGINLSNKLSNELLLALGSHVEVVMASDRGLEKSDLMQHLTRFYDIQGKAERIQNTPFLLIYSAFTRIIVFFYVLLTPLLIGDIDVGGEDSALELLSMPAIAFIGAAFLTINRLANLYGTPFAERETSIPVNDLCAKLVANIDEVGGKLAHQPVK